MKSGDTDIIVLYLEQADGTALTYASKALFQAAGFDLTWYDNAGAALASQPTWLMPVAGSGKRHQFSFTVPADEWTWKVTTPSTHISTPVEGIGEGTTYDIDDIGSTIATLASVPISETTTQTTADIFHGDSIRIDLVVPDAALTAIGASGLADATMKAEIKLDATASSTAATVATLTEAIVTDTPGNYVARVSVSTFPTELDTAMALLTGGKSTLACTLQLRLTKAGKTLIAAECLITVKWRATAP